MKQHEIAMADRVNGWLAACLLMLSGCVGAAAAAEPAAQPRPVLWSIARDGQELGYLLGTIHSEDARVLEFSEPFLEQLRGCRLFAMELVPNLPNLAELAARMRLPPGGDLSELLGEARYSALVGVLSRYGIPESQVRTMQPWAAMMTISVPPPETGLFMDFSLSLRASGNGLRVIGLETLDQQLSFLNAFSLDQQRALLDDALAEAGRVQALHDTLVSAYLENDLDRLSALAMEQLQRLDEELVGVFVREGIEARNRRMLETVLPELTEGGVFVAVGALHLPGEAGLIAQLEARGFDLRPAGSPFARP